MDMSVGSGKFPPNFHGMAIETPKRRLSEGRDSPDLKCASRDETELAAETAPARTADFGLDAGSIAAFRSFFELLDRWDQEENENEK
jgi:hypothetical protein